MKWTIAILIYIDKIRLNINIYSVFYKNKDVNVPKNINIIVKAELWDNSTPIYL